MKEFAVLHTPDGIELEMPIAGLASRMFAALVDYILLGCLWLLGLMVAAAFAVSFESAVWLAFFILFVLFTSWLYPIVFELNMRGQTPGKRMLGLRVVRQDGLPIGRHESILRNLYRAADALPACYVLGFTSIMADPLGRRVGDLVAGTLVIQESLQTRQLSRSGAAWAARAEKGQAQKAVTLPGGSLTAKQLSVLEAFLERAPGLDPMRRFKLAEHIARPLLPLLQEKISDPEEVLRRVMELARSQESPEMKRAPVQAQSGPLF